MEYEATIQSVLDEIDRRITENIRVNELARGKLFHLPLLSGIYGSDWDAGNELCNPS